MEFERERGIGNHRLESGADGFFTGVRWRSGDDEDCIVGIVGHDLVLILRGPILIPLRFVVLDCFDVGVVCVGSLVACCEGERDGDDGAERGESLHLDTPVRICRG